MMTSTTNNIDVSDMEREAFYRRAVADASSLTQAEINLIFGWVSPEEDEQICRANANGKTRAELIAIAATNPEQLTKVESELVQRSQALLTDLRREATNPIHNLPPGLKTLDELAARAQIVMEEALSWNRDPLREEAYQAVWNALDDQERRAIIAAQNRLMQIMDEELAEEERKYPRRMQQPELPEGYVRD